MAQRIAGGGVMRGSSNVWNGSDHHPTKKVRPVAPEQTSNRTQEGNLGGSDYDLE